MTRLGVPSYGGTSLLSAFILLLSTGQVFSSVHRPGNDPPEIVTKPRNLQVKHGGIAAFYCAAKGVPPPVIQWKKNGKRVSESQTRYQVRELPDGSSLLRIEPVRMGRDDATYECVAENGVGDAVTKEATLTVFDRK
ncbi:tyrosine-protein phosphatase Lar-like [Coccinella septempunctata]|uniref:tyrosine-protein phosphatase Lar-like n=1 Tax=Coccinella septempunctata TaxID=41139 RepID=UPI001D072A6B|nr:tyrosine-protein phosphatase Lar-like [Coccinella septempunctata]